MSTSCSDAEDEPGVAPAVASRSSTIAAATAAIMGDKS